MSKQRTDFEAEIRKPNPDWTLAIDTLSSLNMTEMLASLNGLAPTQRSKVAAEAEKLMLTQRKWKGTYERIKFAIDVVNNRKIGWYPDDLPDDQTDDARNFLEPFYKPTGSKAGHAVFDTVNRAARVAISEYNPASVAVDAEYAGSIYDYMGMYGFTKPKRGTIKRVAGKLEYDSDSSVPVPAGTTKVAMIHTHGGGIANPGAEIFSPQDIMIAVARGQFSYLGTPTGRIKKITPRALLPPAEQATYVLGFKPETLQ